MSLKLTPEEAAEMQKQYYYLTNYEGSDPCAPINPLTYVDSNGDHLIHIAAQCDDARTIELLLRAYTKVDELGDMGCTALHYALDGRGQSAAPLLLANGASKNVRNLFGKVPGE